MVKQDKCKCTLAIRLTGDGCRYCQPQEYIDRLEEWLKEEREEHEIRGARMQKMREWLSDACANSDDYDLWHGLMRVHTEAADWFGPDGVPK